MDYDKIKLGLIGNFRVWRARSEAERNRKWRDKIEHEISEVDYSEAEKLKEELLKQKRVRIATRDASRLYKKYYRKNNDGIGEADFINDYLIKNELKGRALPNSGAFKEKYYVGELKYTSEQINKQPKQKDQEKIR